MFAEHVGVHGLGRDLEVSAKQRSKARGVEDRAGTDHPLGRQAGDARRHLGHDIDRVGRDHQNRSRSGSEDLRHHLLEHRGVAIEQLEARLSRPLTDTRGDDHRAGAGQIGVVAGVHARDVRKGRGVQDVFGLCDRPLLILVDQHDLACGAAQHQGVRSGAADHPGANDTDLHRRSLMSG